MSKINITDNVYALLAKLLSGENINVIINPEIHTAAIKIEKKQTVQRTIYLPAWKDVSSDLYALLIAHESAHALYTPKTEEELKEVFTDDPNMFQVFNLVEDARIDKHIKKRYPGIVKAYQNGMAELNERNFFGLSDKSLEERTFLDRINLYYKLGIHTNLNVPFTENEKNWVRAIGAAETYEDAVKITKLLYEAIDKNEIEDFSKNFQKAKLEEGEGEPIEGDMGELKPVEDDDKFSIESQKALANNLQKLDKSTDVYNLNLDIPKDIFESHVVPYPKVYSTIKSFYSRYVDIKSSAQGDLSKFIQDNRGALNYMVKEFELKKAAINYKKTKIAKTGIINTNKLTSYKFKEDIFLKSKVVHKGKKHAMVMFLDMSASMDEYYADTLDQLILLVQFCKKINIPYYVYGMTLGQQARKKSMFNKSFSLREYFNYKMSSVEFNEALNYLFCIRRYFNKLEAAIPNEDRLCGMTLLKNSDVFAVKIVEEVKKSTGAEIVNTIFLTDGDDNDSFFDEVSTRSYGYGENIKVIIEQKRTGFLKICENSTNLHADLLTSLGQITGSNVIGYFILPQHSQDHLIKRFLQDKILDNGYKSDIVNKTCGNYVKNGWAKVTNLGYDHFFFVRSNKTKEDTGFADIKTRRIILSNFVDIIAKNI